MKTDGRENPAEVKFFCVKELRMVDYFCPNKVGISTICFPNRYSFYPSACLASNHFSSSTLIIQTCIFFFSEDKQKRMKSIYFCYNRAIK